MNDDKTQNDWQGYSRNTFGVKTNNNSNEIRLFNNIQKAIVYAVMNYQKEIFWINSNVIITVAEMMIPQRAKFWKEITQE